MNISKLLQEHFNDSGHYLAPSKLKVVDAWVREYIVEVDNECLEKGYEVVRISMNDVFIWLYNKNESLEERIKRIEDEIDRL